MKLYNNLTRALKERSEVEALKLSVQGELPSELFDFPNLREIYFDGDCPAFPREISGWMNVKVLSIKWNHFSGDLSALFNLPRLENLKIIETPIKSFFLPLGHSCAPIKSLTIKNSHLQFLPEEISVLENLQDLNLSGNDLNSLPHAFGELRGLKRLNLDQNNFSRFPDQIKNMKTLSHLSIDSNKFSEEEKARIQREFHLTVH